MPSLRPLALSLLLWPAAAVSQDPPPRLGTISFPTSGAPAAQAAFVTGVLYLHSFEYDSAARAFRAAQQADPGFALAYWGEAMTYNHPIWNEQDRAAARAALARLAPTAVERRARAPTAREQGYLDAVELLYGEGDKPQRDTLYAEAMRRLSEAFPDDLEAKSFYALALLGLNQGVRDVPTYMKAGAIADEVFDANRDHPGAAHYEIHAFDDPVHAPLGLRAARAYSEIAPGAAHAQHMTTHIFLAEGMWDDVVRQNILAAGPDRARWFPSHYTYWLGYGLGQQGKADDERAHLELVRGNVAPNAPAPRRAHLIAMRAQYVVTSERWNDAVLQWTVDTTGLGAVPRAIDLFTQGFAAARRGDAATADRMLAALAALPRKESPTDRFGGNLKLVDALEREIRAAVAQAGGRVEDAIALGREAATIADALPVDFGPPDLVKPPHELLGDLLLAAGRPAEAVVEYRRALAAAPGRLRAVQGLARAEAATPRVGGR